MNDIIIVLLGFVIVGSLGCIAAHVKKQKAEKRKKEAEKMEKEAEERAKEAEKRAKEDAEWDAFFATLDSRTILAAARASKDAGWGQL